MAATQNRTGKEHTLLGGVAGGALTAIIMSIALSAMIASLIQKGYAGEEVIPIAATGILFFSTGVGSLLAGKWTRKKYAVVCGMCAAIVTVILLGLTIFIFDASFSNVARSLIAIALGGVAACAICAGKGGRRKRRSR